MTIKEREAEIRKTMTALKVEEMALKAFKEIGKFTLAIPGYQRMEFRPQQESEAERAAKRAGWLAANTEKLPLKLARKEGKT